MAKQPQYNGKEMYAKAFEFCKTPAEAQKIIRAFERPAEKEYGKCFAKYLAQNMNMLKEDNTMDGEKMALQFTDYGIPAPEETKKMGGVDVDDDQFAERFFAFMKKHQRDISFVFHGHYDETY